MLPTTVTFLDDFWKENGDELVPSTRNDLLQHGNDPSGGGDDGGGDVLGDDCCVVLDAHLRLLGHALDAFWATNGDEIINVL